jgi:hypothetical protein
MKGGFGISIEDQDFISVKIRTKMRLIAREGMAWIMKSM